MRVFAFAREAFGGAPAWAVVAAAVICLAAAFAAGLAAGKGTLSLRRAVIAGLVGFFVNYLVGIPYFACIWAFYLHNGGLWQIIVTGNLLYMPKDLVLCILAAFLAWRVRPLLGRLSA